MIKFLINKIATTLFLFVISFCSYSQVSYKAGDTLSAYFDINPDTLINFTCSPIFISTESYYFDLNGDSQNDLEINASCSLFGVGIDAQIKINVLNSYTSIRFGQYDSAYNNYGAYWMVAKAAKPLIVGDTLNSTGALWDSSLFIYLNYLFTGSSLTIYNWLDSTDRFIGIKYQNVTDTAYGWIRVNCLSGCLIKDFSMSSSLIGISDPEIECFSIYPNPAEDKIFIQQKSNGATEIKLFDLCGRELKKINSNSQLSEMNLNDISKGIYLIQMKTSKGILSKKIVVQN